MLQIIIHIILGFRRLREVDFYSDDSIALRLMGLRKLPDVPTISRALSQMEPGGVQNIRDLSRSIVIEGLQREAFARITMDFGGSVQSTKGHAEGTAILVSIKKRKALAAIIFCFVQWPKPVNFLMSITSTWQCS